MFAWLVCGNVIPRELETPAQQLYEIYGGLGRGYVRRVVDGAWLLLGSSNWDPRSLRLNFEFDLECYDRGLGESLQRWVLDERLRDVEVGADLLAVGQVAAPAEQVDGGGLAGEGGIVQRVEQPFVHGALLDREPADADAHSAAAAPVNGDYRVTHAGDHLARSRARQQVPAN